MTRLSAKFWTASLVLLVLGAADGAGLLCCAALAQQTNDPNSQSWAGSVSSGFKRGFSKIGNALDPKSSAKKPSPEDDAISLNGKSKVGPELHVAIARRYEQLGGVADAEQQYQAALDLKSDYLPALLGYARLKEQVGLNNDAILLYKRAVKAYPREASVHNNIGLCYARQGRLDEAVAAMALAAQLAPKNPLYRNNIATVLVDQGKLREAFKHLSAVHSEAAAYYNMGYLLNRKGQTQAAAQHFALALRADPSMLPAQRWIDHLQKATTQARLPQHPAASGLRITSENGEPDASRYPDFSEPRRNGAEREAASTPPDPPMPRRLPPVSSRDRESDGPALPGISFDRGEGSTAPSAPSAPLPPLPPPAANSAVQHLPRVN